MQQAQPTVEPVVNAMSFDRVLDGVHGLPGYKSTKPSTVIDKIPILAVTTSYIVQTYKTADNGFMIFMQIVDAEGRARFIVPNKVAQAIYRQRQSLADRSTPGSRARKAKARERERQRKARAARREAYRLRNGNN